MKNTVTKLLADYDNVQFAYLFGSYADGTSCGTSDVDLAVYLKDDSLDAQLDLHHFLEKYLHISVDLVCLNTVKNMYLLESILTKGIVVKNHKDLDYYEVRNQHEIIDFKHFKRYIDAA